MLVVGRGRMAREALSKSKRLNSKLRVLVAMPQERTVQPPRIAAWLVGLFITEEQMGELEQTPDKFSDMALRCGSGPARRWYWKQSAKQSQVI